MGRKEGIRRSKKERKTRDHAADYVGEARLNITEEFTPGIVSPRAKPCKRHYPARPSPSP